MTTGKQPMSASAMATQLRGLGFSDVMVTPPRRLIVSGSGREKQGKTHFALTAPDPIIFISIDIGTEGVVNKFQAEGKKVFVYDVRVPKGEKQEVYDSLWKDIKKRLEVVYAMNQGTVIIDTASEAYELARLAHFGKLTQVLPHHYTVVKAEWREFLRLAYDSNMNSVFLHKLKPKYVDNVRTREYEIAGMDEIPYLVQCNIRMYKEQGKFCTLIENCRQNPALDGQIMREPNNDFGFLLDLVHGPA
jgi:hypothetical protein